MVDAEDAFRQLGVCTVDGVTDVYQVRQLDKVVLGSLQVVRVGAVDRGDAVLVHPDPDRLPIVIVQTYQSLVLGIPERFPGVVHGRQVSVDFVCSPADPGQVDGVGDRVARPSVVVGVSEHWPDVLLQVRQVVVVQGLQQLPRHELRDDLGRGDEDVEVDLAGSQFPSGLLEVVEGRELDLDAELLLEVLEHARVDVIRPVVQAQRPLLGLEPRLDHRVVVVQRLLYRVFPGADDHARSRRGGSDPRTATGEQPAAAVPAISFRASRRDIRRRQGDLSFGWNAISNNLLSGRPVQTSRPYPSAASSSCPAPPSSLLRPYASGSKPNSRAAAAKHISLTSSPLTAGSSNSTWSARPSMSAERYVAKRSGSHGPNSPDRWPSLTTSAIVLRQRRSSASRLRAASSSRRARDHNSTHSVQYSSLSRRTTGGQANSINRTSRLEAPSMPVSSRKASM